VGDDWTPDKPLEIGDFRLEFNCPAVSRVEHGDEVVEQYRPWIIRVRRYAKAAR